MPTVDRWNNCRAYFWSHEGNEPAHVYIDCAEKSVKLWLHDVTLAYNDGFNAVEIARLIDRVRHRRDKYKEAWNEYFGRARS